MKELTDLSYFKHAIYAWNGPDLKAPHFLICGIILSRFIMSMLLTFESRISKSYLILNNPFTVYVRQVSRAAMRLLS